MKAIVGGELYYQGKFHREKILCFEKEICEILDQAEFEKEGVEIIKAHGCKILPGLIDVHVHGYGGVDTMDQEDDALEKLSLYMAQNGVTSFLPTTMAAEIQYLQKVLHRIRKRKNKESPGARILGAHLEGPFLNSNRAGAQNKKYLELPNCPWITEYKDVISVLTIAPELDGAANCIQENHEDICFSLGHSEASLKESLEAFQKGAKSITHLFNGMPSIHHRDIGLVGAGLFHDCYVELICDDMHLSPFIYSLVYKTKKINQILLITDCMRAGGMEDGVYDLGGQEIVVTNGICKTKKNALAGSTLTMVQAVENFSLGANISFEEALICGTINPAQYLGLASQIGSLEVGKWADIVILDEKNNVQKTFVSGKLVFEK